MNWKDGDKIQYEHRLEWNWSPIEFHKNWKLSMRQLIQEQNVKIYEFGENGMQEYWFFFFFQYSSQKMHHLLGISSDQKSDQCSNKQSHLVSWDIRILIWQIEGIGSFDGLLDSVKVFLSLKLTPTETIKPRRQ